MRRSRSGKRMNSASEPQLLHVNIRARILEGRRTARIPAGKEIDRAWEETSLKHAQNCTQASQRLPVRRVRKSLFLNESSSQMQGPSYHQVSTPGHDNHGNENARSDFSNDSGRQRLDDDIGYEEHQHHD